MSLGLPRVVLSQENPMRLFQKLKKVDGCRAISFQDTSVCAVHVRHVPSTKPQVTQALLAPPGGTTEAALLEQEGRGLALLSFDERGGLLTITAGGELYVARRIEATHAQVLHPDAERTSMAHERVALEIQRSLDHFGRQYPSIALPKL